jgi:hypothetical protein
MIVYFAVLHFADSSARGTDRIMMLFGYALQLVLYDGGCKLMAYNNFGVQQQFDRVIDRRPAYMKMVVFQLFPYRIECKKIFRPAYLCKNGIPLCRMSEFSAFQIFGECSLQDVVMLVCIVHVYIRILYNAEQRYDFFPKN